MTGTTKQLFLIGKIRDTPHVRAIPDKGIKPVITFHHTDFPATDLNLFHSDPGKFFGQPDFGFQRRIVINGRIKGLH